MSGADPAAEPADSLRRGLALRIGVALATLAVLGALALFIVSRPNPGHRSEEATPAPAVDTTSAPLPLAEPAPPGRTTPPAASGSPASASAAKSQAAESGQAGADLGTGSGSGPTGQLEAHEEPPAAAPREGPQRAADEAQASVQHPGTRARTDGVAPAPPQFGAGPASESSNAMREEGAEPGTEPTDAVREPAASAAAAEAARAQTAERPAAVPPRPVSDKPPRGPRLQAGVFLQPANADAFKASLEAKGLPVYIESRVYVGPFRERKEAERARQTLQEMGVSSVLIGK